MIKDVRTPAEARARLNKFVRSHGARKTLFNMDKTVITEIEHDEKKDGVWVSGWTEDYDMCWEHEGMPHFTRLGALTAEMTEGEDWLQADKLHGCEVDDAEEEEVE